MREQTGKQGPSCDGPSVTEFSWGIETLQDFKLCLDLGRTTRCNIEGWSRKERLEAGRRLGNSPEEGFRMPELGRP